MDEKRLQGIELLPETTSANQLFVLLHGVGASAHDVAPLAEKLRGAFPGTAFLLPDGSCPFDGGGNGRQWFSINGVTEANRPARVTGGMPAVHDIVRQAQRRFDVLPSATALVGFSQGAIMALEFSAIHDGMVGRVLAFSGRFARLPDKAPEFTTLHLLHGAHDNVIPVSYAHAAYERLSSLQGDATLDIAATVGHEINPELSDRALYRLQTCIPLRGWAQALSSK